MDRIPHSVFIVYRSSFLVPHSSFLIPHSSFLIPRDEPLLRGVSLHQQAHAFDRLDHAIEHRADRVENGGLHAELASENSRGASGRNALRDLAKSFQDMVEAVPFGERAAQTIVAGKRAGGGGEKIAY